MPSFATAAVRVAVRRSSPSLATTAGGAMPLVLALLGAVPLAAAGAQDTLRPPAGPMLIQVPSAAQPVVRVSIGDDALVPGDQGRVSVRARADGYVVVLQADPAGHVRVLFPLDPDDAAIQAIGADSDLVVRSRGGGRDAFTAGSALGDGTVLAAFSASRPFRGGRFARNGHWDPRALPHVDATASAEGELLAVVGDMLPQGAKFDYDVATYRVGEPLPVIASAAGAEGDVGQQAAADDGYDSAMPMSNGYATAGYGGYGGYYDSFYDGYYGGFFNGYYGGIFPIVVVAPTSFRGGSRHRGGGLYPVGIDPFYLALGCPPIFFTSFGNLPRFDGRGGGGHTGYRQRGGDWVAYSGQHATGPYLLGSGPPPVARTPYTYRNRAPSAATRPPSSAGSTLYRRREGSAGSTRDAGRVVVSPPPARNDDRGDDDATADAPRTEPRGWAPMTWHPMEREAGVRVYRGSVSRSAPPAAAPSSSQPRLRQQQQEQNGGGAIRSWGAPPPSRATPTRSGGGGAAPSRAAPERHAPAPPSGGGARIRPR